MEQSYSIRFQE